MRRLLTTLIALALFAVALPAFAGDDHDKPRDTTSTTTPEQPTTTIAETTTTIQRVVEVCRDGQIISVPVNQITDTDERIWDDFDRRDCQPSHVPTPTTIPEVVVWGPIYSVGYICPGTDGVVYELPWGTAEDMWPTPESAKAYGCPVVEELPVVLIAPISTPPTQRLTELPFTGINPGLSVLAGLALLGLGGLLVRRSDA